MRVLAAVFVLSLVTAHAAEHKSIWPPFTPERNAYARRLVTEHFQIVRSLDQIDPGVWKAFYKIAPRRDIAVGSQPFAETDISDGRPKRFDFGVHSADLWFI